MRPSRGIYTKPIPTGRKPLTSHSHPSQWEFFRVLRGNLTIEFRDGELAVPTYTHHVMYWIPRTKMNEIEFVMSASDPAVDEEGAVVVDQPFLGKYGLTRINLSTQLFGHIYVLVLNLNSVMSRTIYIGAWSI
ncbi:hypothetical protein ACN42_g9440 [Penicillium freii]|uniref:Uncharacterized protein n=1 Tax=Penicillium freii TaxID=48697 RepID=A0A124GQC9_PENFR|nr:hypothetical protein ACN42_g9440 [Penicillium freii]